AATGAELRSFFAYTNFNGSVFVAAGDVNNDGQAEIITGAGPGTGSHVKVFDGITNATRASFFAFDPKLLVGVLVDSFHHRNDGFADIVIRGPSTVPGLPARDFVRVLDGLTLAELSTIFA